MLIDSVRVAFRSLNNQQAIVILNPTDELEYLEIAVEPMKLHLRINQENGYISGSFTIGMVETKRDAQEFIPKFLKRFDGLPVGPFVISHSKDEVGCIIQNDFALRYRDVVPEHQLLRDLEEQTILATTILISLVYEKKLLYPDQVALDKYTLNVGQELYKNVLESRRLLRSA